MQLRAGTRSFRSPWSSAAVSHISAVPDDVRALLNSFFALQITNQQFCVANEFVAAVIAKDYYPDGISVRLSGFFTNLFGQRQELRVCADRMFAGHVLS